MPIVQNLYALSVNHMSTVQILKTIYYEACQVQTSVPISMPIQKF
jgi:hypothetical protein